MGCDARGGACDPGGPRFFCRTRIKCNCTSTTVRGSGGLIVRVCAGSISSMVYGFFEPSIRTIDCIRDSNDDAHVALGFTVTTVGDEDRPACLLCL